MSQEPDTTLTDRQRRQIHYWMRLTRTLDDQIISMWKQGRGLGGTFSQRGHEAISVGAGFALGPDDLVAPLHRDLGCYLLRGMTPARLLASQLGRTTGVNRGRDANLHGCGDLDLNIIGFISHLPQSMPVALGAAMTFQYRNEPRVAMTFVGDGSSNTGLFHETLNLAAVRNAPLIVIVENNQYAYSTPIREQMAIEDIAIRATAQGVRAQIVDGNDVELVYQATKKAAERARSGGGPTLIEAKTMRMLGHAIHDGAQYVPAELLETWQKRDPLDRYEQVLRDEGISNDQSLEAVKVKCKAEVTAAVRFAEDSPWPDPQTVGDAVYAP